MDTTVKSEMNIRSMIPSSPGYITLYSHPIASEVKTLKTAKVMTWKNSLFNVLLFPQKIRKMILQYKMDNVTRTAASITFSIISVRISLRTSSWGNAA